MGKIVAYGGGEWHRTLPIQHEILKLTGRATPKVLFVPTAGKDNEDSCEEFTKVYGKLGTKVRPAAGDPGVRLHLPRSGTRSAGRISSSSAAATR